MHSFIKMIHVPRVEMQPVCKADFSSGMGPIPAQIQPTPTPIASHIKIDHGHTDFARISGLRGVFWFI